MKVFDRSPVSSADELVKILKTLKGGVLLEGVYPGKEGRFYYAFGV